MPRDDANKPGSLYPGFRTAVAEFFKWTARTLQIDETQKETPDPRDPVRRMLQPAKLYGISPSHAALTGVLRGANFLLKSALEWVRAVKGPKEKCVSA
jgi:hypothetical protein